LFANNDLRLMLLGSNTSAILQDRPRDL